MTAPEIALLVAGGLVAGVVNTLAGGGSLLTVPLLVLLGLPGTVANGTNRLGILIQSVVATGAFRAQGVPALRAALPILPPVLLGSLLGATLIARASDETFEQLFGVLMLVMLIPSLRRSPPGAGSSRPWPPAAKAAVFFAVGLYGGAFQAGVGVVLVFALAHAGSDLVRANAAKMVVVTALTAIALPVFWIGGQIAWAPAAALAGGYALGGALGARLAVRSGEALIRPLLALAVIALAGRMLGVYGPG